MKVGFHYHIPAILKEDGKIYMPGYLALFIEGLAQQCNEVICFLHSPLQNELHLMDHALRTNNVSLVDIGIHNNMIKRTINFRTHIKKISLWLPKIDIMLIRGPSPLMPFVSRLCQKNSTPYAYLLVGDYLKSLSGVERINPLKRVVLWSFYYFNKRLQDYYSNKALIFTNNKVIYNEYAIDRNDVYEIRTTTLSEEDFFVRDSACTNQPFKLAYAGRIEPTKGIEDMLDAIALLVSKGIDTQLHIAGWDPVPGEKYLKKLYQVIEEKGLKESFFFHGKKQVGKELFSFYRCYDAFVIATRGNEGFPRTIWEAMAQSMPVISTRVGSIPDMLEDGKTVLLVDQASPDQLADAVIKLKHNNKLRRELITNGYALARTNTLEIQSKKMITVMERFLSVI